MNDLDRKSMRVLKYIYKHPYTPCLQLECFKTRGIDRTELGDIVKRLIDINYVSCRIAPNKEADRDRKEHPYDGLDGYLVALPDGRAHFEDKKERSLASKIGLFLTSIIGIGTIVATIISSIL